MSEETQLAVSAEFLAEQRNLIEQRLEEVQRTYRSAAEERRELITLANAIGVPIRRIARTVDESPSTVSNWVRRPRRP